MPAEASIKQNAALVVETCKELVDFPFGYDEQSVAWLEGYIERQRIRGTFAQNADTYCAVFGSYLGECIIAAYGGRWHEDEQYALHVLLEGDLRAFPFAKVRKQMEGGLDGGDSILAFFRSIRALLTMHRSPD